MSILKWAWYSLFFLGACVVEEAITKQRPAECNFPPSLWCSSRDIAESCWVMKQCSESVWSKKVDASPVSFALYYESLCPGCRGFISGQLFKAFNQVGEIMNLTLVPYGNAEEKREGDHWKFECQHGEQECIGNVIETCALNIVNSMKEVFPFIHCMEGFKGGKPEKAAKFCAQKLSNIPIENILSCANSSKGNELEHQMALKTNALHPPHKYVPWVTLNGVHTKAIQDKAMSSLVDLICDTYKGKKPSGCEQTGPKCFRTFDRK